MKRPSSFPRIPGPETVTEGAQTGRLMINLEDLVLLEERLSRITEGVKVFRSSEHDFEEWWMLTANNTLAATHTLFREERVRNLLKEAAVLEVVSVSLSEFCFLIRTPPSIMLSQVQSLMFSVHQNFLVVLSFLLTRLAPSANSWAQVLNRIIEDKRVQRAKRCANQDLLRQNNYVITNLINNVCRLNVLRNTQNRVRAYRVIVLAGMQVMKMIGKVEVEEVRRVMQQALDVVAYQGVNGPLKSAEEIPLDVEVPAVSVPYLPPLKTDKYTLVLDLDETLVHYYETESSGQYMTRPGLRDFLAQLVPYYELVVFTAAMQEYADWVLDEVDVGHCISHRLYRQHTVQVGDALVKDLNKLGRDVSRTIIIDNVQESFQMNPGNGILIRSWFDDVSDRALMELLPLLKGDC